MLASAQVAEQVDRVGGQPIEKSFVARLVALHSEYMEGK